MQDSRQAKKEAENGTPDGLETQTCEYFTGTRALTSKNGITKEPYKLAKAEARWVAKSSLKPSPNYTSMH